VTVLKKINLFPFVSLFCFILLHIAHRGYVIIGVIIIANAELVEFELVTFYCIYNKQTEQTPWSESASELYRPSDRCLSGKLVLNFVDRECHVVSMTDPSGRILGFLDRCRYFSFQIFPQLYSRGWVDTVPIPLLLKKNLITPGIQPGTRDL
jgi:hypothetical protein